MNSLLFSKGGRFGTLMYICKHDILLLQHQNFNTVQSGYVHKFVSFGPDQTNKSQFTSGLVQTNIFK